MGTNLLGVKQIIIGINKMDCDIAGYKESRYDEIANQMKNMLAKVGWKKDFLEKNVTFMAISGWCGDNLVKKTTNMAWWKGQNVETVYDCLDKMCRAPPRPTEASMRLPISG